MPDKIGVLISGGGSNLQAIIDAVESGFIPGAKVAVVISNRSDAFGLERARKHGIDSIFVNPKNYSSPREYSAIIENEMLLRNVNLVCLAGYLLKIEPAFVKTFKGKILNIHPALLPKYGGKGMYGHHVHESVLLAGEKESGCTVHVVDEIYDNGRIILQKKVPVQPGDTPETLAKRVLEQEHKTYPEAIKLFFENKI